MMLRKLKSIIATNKLDDIILTGITSVEDRIAEFIPDSRHVYFDFNDILIEFQSVGQYSKIRIGQAESVIHKPDFEDVLPGYASIGSFIFTNPMGTNKVKSISFINAKEYDFSIECDVLEIILENGQLLFIDPTFFGINIGGEEQRMFWEETRNENGVFDRITIDV